MFDWKRLHPAKIRSSSWRQRTEASLCLCVQAELVVSHPSWSQDRFRGNTIVMWLDSCLTGLARGRSMMGRNSRFDPRVGAQLGHHVFRFSSKSKCLIFDERPASGSSWRYKNVIDSESCNFLAHSSDNVFHEITMRKTVFCLFGLGLCAQVGGRE